MNANDMLDVIGEIKGSYIMEAQCHREGRPKPRSRVKVLLIAALISLLLAGCTYAVLKLQNLRIGAYVPEPLYEGETFSEERLNQSVLSLQGYVGSPEYQAAKEWFEFEEAYDPDGTLMLEADLAGKGGPEPPDRYDGYSAYTQEMRDKIDEICEKYSLQPLGKEWWEQSEPEFVFEATGIQGIFTPAFSGEANWYDGFYYESGSFSINGELAFGDADGLWRGDHSFYFLCCAKGTFDDATAIINIDQAEEWEYTTQDGTKVLMVLDDLNARIIADRTDCFLTARIAFALDEHEKPTRQAVEAFAEFLDWNIHPQKVPFAVLEAREKAFWEEYAKGVATGMTCYDKVVKRIWSRSEHPERIGYTFLDVNGDGTKELITGQDGYVSTVDSESDGKIYSIVGSGFNMFGGAATYLYEGNVVGSEGNFFRLEGGRPQPCEGDFQKIVLDLIPLSMYPLDEFPEIDPEFKAKRFASSVNTSFAPWVKDVLENDYNEDPSYAMLDLTGDGEEELYAKVNNAFSSGYFYYVYTMQDGHMHKLMLEPNPVTVCENGVLETAIDCGGRNMVYRYSVFENNREVMIDYLRIDYDRNPDNPWFRSIDASGQDMSLEPITEEEFEAIRAKYPPLGLELKPLSEFPLN